MQGDAILRFGYDGAQIDRGVPETEKKIRKLGEAAETSMTRATTQAGRLERSLKSAGGGMTRNLGQVSMQVQDIAVQLQSGTKASIVFAQQGSQILSAFGAGGAIVGGLVAIGGAFYTMGEMSHTSFVKMKEDAKAFEGVFQSMLVDSSPDKLGQNLKALHDSVAEAKDKLKQLQSPAGVAAAKMNELAGGESLSSQVAEATRLKYEAEDRYGKLLEATLATSQKEVEIGELRRRGEDAKADAMERQLKLAVGLAHIDELKIANYAKEQLKADYTKRVAQQDEQDARKKNEAERQKQQSAQREIESKREAFALDKRGIEMIEAQAKGQDRKVKRMEKEGFISRRAKELNKNDIGPDAAIALAQREWKARENLEEYKKTGRRKIGGVGSGSEMKKRYMHDNSLGDWNIMQMKRETGLNEETRPGYSRGQMVPVQDAFFSSRSDPTAMQRRGRYMGGNGGALSDRNNRSGARSHADSQVNYNVKKQAATAANDVGGKLDQSNNHLKAIAEAIV